MASKGKMIICEITLNDFRNVWYRFSLAVQGVDRGGIKCNMLVHTNLGEGWGYYQNAREIGASTILQSFSSKAMIG